MIARCSVASFAVTRVEFDGGYAIDWSEWDSENPEVTGYSIMLNEFLYMMYCEEDVADSDDALADVYESCELVDGEWICEGLLRDNYYEDWNCNSTQIRELGSNLDLTEWSSALDSPGRHMAQESFVRWSGDATDPDNEPAEVTYTVKTIGMGLHYFVMYEGNNSSGRDVILVDGANGFN